MKFIGIDLSWKVKPFGRRKSGLAVLDEKGILEDATFLSTDEEIIDFVKAHAYKGCIIGIDSPLKVPNESGQRRCENILLKLGIGVLPANKQWFDRAFGGIRGEILIKKFKAEGFTFTDSIDRPNVVLEVYPSVSWKLLFDYEKVPRFKNVKKEKKLKSLKELRDNLISSKLSPPITIDDSDLPIKIVNAKIDDFNHKQLDQYGDLLDAIMAAYTVYLFWRCKKRCRIIGNMDEGYILIPYYAETLSREEQMIPPPFFL